MRGDPLRTRVLSAQLIPNAPPGLLDQLSCAGEAPQSGPIHQ